MRQSGPPRRFDSGGPRRSFGNRPGGGFADKQLYDAECNSCHERCQVPFRPNGKKPVYCKNCFKPDERQGGSHFEKRDSGAFRPSASRPDDRRMDDIVRRLDTITATLDRLVETIEKSQRATSLRAEVRKHIPSAKPADAPEKAALKARKVPAKRAKKA